MEFTVTRTDSAESAPSRPTPEPRQWSYTASRIVLSARGAAEMLNKMQELQNVMLQQGLISHRPVEATTDAPAARPQPS